VRRGTGRGHSRVRDLSEFVALHCRRATNCNESPAAPSLVRAGRRPTPPRATSCLAKSHSGIRTSETGIVSTCGARNPVVQLPALAPQGRGIGGPGLALMLCTGAALRRPSDCLSMRREEGCFSPAVG